MVNKFLLPIYKEIFNEQFEYNSPVMRLKMQEAIFLLQELGAPIGDYGFSWYNHEPYSQVLSNDIYDTSHSKEEEINFSTLSKDNQNAINQIRSIFTISTGIKYSYAQWRECIVSILYLRENVLPRNTRDFIILNELKRENPSLNQDRDNHEALKIIQTFFH